jgi:hypothetical protein
VPLPETIRYKAMITNPREVPLSFEHSVQQAVVYALKVMHDESAPTHRRDRMAQFLLQLPLPTIRHKGKKSTQQERAEAVAIDDDRFGTRKTPGDVPNIDIRGLAA